MRALMVLCALVATPFVIGVSQLPGKSSCDNGNGTASRSTQGTMQAHKGLCVPQDPPPPPGGGSGGTGGTGTGGTTGGGTSGGTGGTSGACGNGVLTAGTASIDGQVFVDASPWPGLTGWCVQLSGPVSATALTDANGNYAFTGLPAGTYTICEALQSGWTQTFPTSGPSCAGGLGYSVTLADGAGAGFIWFGNIQ
jgi:SdrD B-like protein